MRGKIPANLPERNPPSFQFVRLLTGKVLVQNVHQPTSVPVGSFINRP